jgi:hypothetical protein
VTPTATAEAQNEEDRICRHDTGVCGTEVQNWTCDAVVGDVCPGEEEADWMVGRGCTSMEWTEICGEEVEGKYACGEEGLSCEVGLHDVCRAPSYAGECGVPCVNDPGDLLLPGVACVDDESCAPGGGCQIVMGLNEDGEEVEYGRGCRCCLTPLAPTCWDPLEDRGGCFEYP